jgi:hypothetical protein
MEFAFLFPCSKWLKGKFPPKFLSCEIPIEFLCSKRGLRPSSNGQRGTVLLALWML